MAHCVPRFYDNDPERTDSDEDVPDRLVVSFRSYYPSYAKTFEMLRANATKSSRPQRVRTKPVRYGINEK